MMKSKKRDWLKIRIFVAFSFFLVFFGLILLRATQVQVINGQALNKKAKSQHFSSITIESKRGNIFDRRGRELAVSLDVDSIYVQPRRVTNVSKSSRVLSNALYIDETKAKQYLNSPRQFVWVKRQVDLEGSVRKEITSMDGVGIVKEGRRFYPNGVLASNLIGFTGVDSKGLEGVELQFDKFLKGESTVVKIERDARGNISYFEDVATKTQGFDIELTIDKNIQYISEKALKKAIKKTEASAGIVVVMDPNTGEVLSMANYPTFDPNNFKSFEPYQWRNRAITDSFEPGSTLKPFVVAAAIEEELIGPNDIFYCENGKYNVYDKTIHDVEDYGWLSVANIIKHSSNIGMAKISDEIGGQILYNYLKGFGFHDKTGLGLPGETRGILRHYKRWSPVALNNISFGQGVSVSALQMANAFSVLANGGYLMRPYVVKEVQSVEGVVVLENNPSVVRRVISSDTAEKVKSMLVAVTDEDGTAPKARVRGVSVAGKTGTAQKANLIEGGYYRDKYITSFVGYFPADNPVYTILVAIDEPQKYRSGGLSAAPVFAEIAEQILHYKGVYANKTGNDKEEGKFAFASFDREYKSLRVKEKISSGFKDALAVDGEKVVPNFTGLTVRKAFKMAAMEDVETEFVGSGTALKQTPKAGAVVDSESDSLKVKVWFN